MNNDNFYEFKYTYFPKKSLSIKKVESYSDILADPHIDDINSINIRRTPYIFKLPPNIKKIECILGVVFKFPKFPESLAYLKIRSNLIMHNLPILPHNMQQLSILYCPYIKFTENLPPNLHILEIVNCKNIKIQSIPKYITYLSLFNVTIDINILDMQSLDHLETFYCCNNGLNSLPKLPKIYKY